MSGNAEIEIVHGMAAKEPQERPRKGKEIWIDFLALKFREDGSYTY